MTLNTIDYCLKGEEWRDIPDYEGSYQASNFGRIRTVQGKTTYTLRHGVRKWGGRVMKPRGPGAKTGCRVSLWKDNEYKEFLVARLIGFTFLGVPNDSKMTINHIDGNRLNNNLNNLEWLSLADNIRHAFANNLMPHDPINIKVSNKIHPFNSMAEASKFIGRSHGYVSQCAIRKSKMTTLNGLLVEVV